MLVVANGDINDDGVMNVVDVMLGLQILNGQIVATADQLSRGDVAAIVGGVPSPDGAFNVGDLLVIQRLMMGAISF